MKKNFALTATGKHPDRVLEAVKHEIRKYLRRERRRELPEGVDFLDFDCRFGFNADSADVVHLSALIGQVDAAAREGAASVYVEILAKPGHRTKRPPTEEASPDLSGPSDPSHASGPSDASASPPVEGIEDGGAADRAADSNA